MSRSGNPGEVEAVWHLTAFLVSSFEKDLVNILVRSSVSEFMLKGSGGSSPKVAEIFFNPYVIITVCPVDIRFIVKS